MITVGKVRQNSLEQECNVEWKTTKLKSISTKKNKWYHSPEFSFSDATWCLGICPYNDKNEESVGYINLFLFKKSSVCFTPISLQYSLVIKAKDEKSNLVKHCSSNYLINGEGYGATGILKTSEFLERKSEFAPNDVLTIICRLRQFEYDDSDVKDTVTEECSYCKNNHSISIHEKKCLDKPIKCPECSDVIKLRDWYEHVCEIGKIETKRATVHEKMKHKFKDIMISGEHSDILIIVKETEFPLHRSILAARNSFFSAMFKNEVKEEVTSTVTINDCEPNIFHQFIHFLYMGKVEKMSEDNVCSLYEVSNKYQEEQLKEQCLNFMVNGISVEYFCDFIILALKFDEKKLLEKANEFFLIKSKEIVGHVKWQNFAKEYHTQANELIINELINASNQVKFEIN